MEGEIPMDHLVKKKAMPYRSSMSTRNDKEQHTALFLTTLGLVMFTLFVFPFKKGVFNGDQTIFQSTTYWYLLVASLLLLLLSIHLFKSWTIQHKSDLLSI